MTSYGPEERALFESEAAALFAEIVGTGGIAVDDPRIAVGAARRPALELLLELGLALLVLGPALAQLLTAGVELLAVRVDLGLAGLHLRRGRLRGFRRSGGLGRLRASRSSGLSASSVAGAGGGRSTQSSR